MRIVRFWSSLSLQENDEIVNNQKNIWIVRFRLSLFIIFI